MKGLDEVTQEEDFDQKGYDVDTDRITPPSREGSELNKSNIISIEDINNKKAYNSLLDALDLIRLTEIYNEVENLISSDGRFCDFASIIALVNKEGIDSIYSDTSKEGIKRSYSFFTYLKISALCNYLSEHHSSIKTQFTNFPWKALEGLGDQVYQCITNNRYDLLEAINKDLNELQSRLKYIIQVTEIQRPEANKLINLIREKEQRPEDWLKGFAENLEPIVTKEGKVNQAPKIPTFIDKHYRSLLTVKYKDSIFIDPEDTKPKGLMNIRKIMEPNLDKTSIKKLEELISVAEECDLTTVKGKAALSSIMFMVGETSKTISEQTKLKSPDIPFKELKKSRDDIHSNFDYNEKATKYLDLIETEEGLETFSNKLEDITRLANTIKGCEIPTTFEGSDPSDSEAADHFYRLSDEESTKILGIITRALPKIPNLDQLKTKYDLCKKVFSGEMPFPLKTNMPGWISLIFAEEIAPDKDIIYALNRNYASLLGPKVYKAMEKIHNLTAVINYQYDENLTTTTDTNTLKKDDIEYLTKTKPCNNKHNTRIKTNTNSLETADYIEGQLKTLGRSLKSINSITTDAIENAKTHREMQDALKDTQIFYSHLFYLIVIGQCIHNVLGKEGFKCDSKLLVEFEFLKWVRNSIMHNSDVKEIGSLFSYFNNDLLNKDILLNIGRTYDSVQYLEYINGLIDDHKGGTPEVYHKQQFYKELVLLQLERAHHNKEYQVERLIVKIYEGKVGSELDSGHNAASRIIKEKGYLDIKALYDKREGISTLASKYNLTITDIFGNIVEVSVTHGDTPSGIFVCSNSEDTGSGKDKNLAFFKQELKLLLEHRLLVATQENKEEADDAKENADIINIPKKYDYNNVLDAITLHVLIEENHERMIEALLKQTPNLEINLRYKGYAAVHKLYKKYKGSKALQLLLNKGADVNVQDKHEKTLAHYAAENNDADLLQLLKSSNADFSIQDNDKKTPFETCSDHNSVDAYRFLFNLTRLSHIQKLVHAVKLQQINDIKGLLAQPDAGGLNTEIDEELIFNIACGIGNLEVIKLLKENGCDPHLVDNYGRNGLHEACYADNIDPVNSIKVIKYLLNINLDINKQACNGDTALSRAVWSKDLRIIEFLLKNGANPDLNTPLLSLAKLTSIGDSELNVVALLLKYQVDILVTDNYVGNAMHLAAERNHLDLAKLLVKHALKSGTLHKLFDPSLGEVYKGLTPIEIASKYNNTKVVTFLNDKAWDKEESSPWITPKLMIGALLACGAGYALYKYVSSTSDADINLLDDIYNQLNDATEVMGNNESLDS